MKKHIVVLAGIFLTLFLTLAACTGGAEKPGLQAPDTPAATPATEAVAPAATQDTAVKNNPEKVGVNKKDDDDDDDDDKK